MNTTTVITTMTKIPDTTTTNPITTTVLTSTTTEYTIFPVLLANYYPTYRVFIVVMLILTSLLLLQFYIKMIVINKIALSNQLKVYLICYLFCATCSSVCFVSYLIDTTNDYLFNSLIFDFATNCLHTVSTIFIAFAASFLFLDRIFAIVFLGGNRRMYLYTSSLIILPLIFIAFFVTLWIRAYSQLSVRNSGCNFGCSVQYSVADFYWIKMACGFFNIACGGIFAALYFKHASKFGRNENRKNFTVLVILPIEFFCTVLPMFNFIFFPTMSAPFIPLRAGNLITVGYTLGGFFVALTYWSTQRKTGSNNTSTGEKSRSFFIKKINPKSLFTSSNNNFS